MGHRGYTQEYRCCIYLKIRPLGQRSKTSIVSVQLSAVCYREEEIEEQAELGRAGTRWPGSPLQHRCGTNAHGPTYSSGSSGPWDLLLW